MRNTLIFLSLLLMMSMLMGQTTTDGHNLDRLFDLIGDDNRSAEETKDYLLSHWDDVYIAPLVDLIFISRTQRKRDRIANILELKTGLGLGAHPYDWWQWMWDQEPTFDPDYADFKATIYKKLDRRFSTYFKNRGHQMNIRLDEVLWGGVQQDGIPPLRDPFLIESDQAKYLSDNDIVFGIVINGDARAYPQRILAWHEMVVDNIDNKRIAGVYCTLCGTVIAYDTEFDGISHELGTSGFLYKSNKLMYDKATQSLWNTIEGQPVIGPLIDKGITLNTYPVITSTWGQWKKSHPQTLVLSLKTGHRRDYSAGAAYRDYYATDELMFPVPLEDNKLKNKQEVFIIRSDHYKSDPLAISTKYLKKNELLTVTIGDENFVILTDKKGGSRAYHSGAHTFEQYVDNKVIDSKGDQWSVHEDQILADGYPPLSRVPSHNIFWFAWFNTFPDTRLIK